VVSRTDMTFHHIFPRFSFLRSIPATLTLAGICVLVFAVQAVTQAVPFLYGYSFATAFDSLFGLNGALLFKGFFWQPFTYIFLHAGWGHLVFNLFTMLFFGAALEMEIGPRRFTRLFFIGGVLGGLGWLGVTALMPLLPPMASLTAWIPAAARTFMEQTLHLQVGAKPATFQSAFCVGASGAVFALLGGYAALFPTRVVYGVLLVIPFKMKARTLAFLLMFLTVLDAVLIQTQVAYAAHLVGGVAGYLLARRWRRAGACFSAGHWSAE
jgi:membrane associated rhomboid family serine protease